MAGDQNTGSRGLTTPDGRTYLKKLPASITADQVLVHNAVPPTRVLGPHGFRAWTQPTTHPLAVEECVLIPMMSLGHSEIMSLAVPT